nr:MAG TPA: hypothetical protein [Caudoviricetes sp.]
MFKQGSPYLAPRANIPPMFFITTSRLAAAMYIHP